LASPSRAGVYYVSEIPEQQQAAPVTTEYVMVLAAKEPLAQGDASASEVYLDPKGWRS
jgi:hypothetical protein